jgi:hypothetical protein
VTNQSGFGRWLLVLAAGLVVVSVLGYRVLSENSATPTDGPMTNAAAEPAAIVVPTPTANVEPAPAASVAEPAVAVPAAEPAPAASAAEPAVAASAAEPSPAASASAASVAASDTGIRRVMVKSNPKKVRFFHFGKQVGVTPFVLELKPGERHAYEAGLPGYGTRKVVIDGSKPQIMVGLTREKP